MADAKKKRELLNGPLLKVERAKHHVLDLDRQVTDYLTTKPFQLRIRQSENPPQRLVYVEAKEPIPAHFALIIGDAVHNLRSALDHLCFGMVGDKAKNPSGVGFPFAKGGSQSLAGAITTRQMHLAPKEVIDEIHNLQPYEGGKLYLNAVKVLDERDKHHFIVTVGTALQFTVAQLEDLVGDRIGHLPGHVEVSTVGDFVMPLDGSKPFEIFDKEANFQPPLTIGFAHGEALSGMPVIPSLNNMVKVTQDAIRELGAAFFR